MLPEARSRLRSEDAENLAFSAPQFMHCESGAVYDFKMRPIACAIALLLLNSVIFAQSDVAPKLDRDVELGDITYCPRTHVLEGDPEEQYWLEGTIRNSKVRMYLHRAGADVVGLFYATDGDWTPTFLGGEWSAQGITLLGESAHEAPEGRLQGQLVNGVFTGSWATNNSDHADPVRVAATQKPSCDGSGVWKRFDDPKWPVSFSYPASWHIKEVPASWHIGDVDNELQLICPDPEVMTYDTVMTIYQGKEAKGKPIGPGELVHCTKGWRQEGRGCDDYDGKSDLYRIAEVSQRPGRTVLDVEHEWRVYCSDGGYRGQGEGDDQVVLFPNYWIEFDGAGQGSDFVDRLVKSVRVRTAPHAK